MDDTLETPKPRRRKYTLVSFIGIVVSVAVIIFVILLATNDSVRNLVQPNNAGVDYSPRPSSTPPIISKLLTFQGCDIKKEGNPLVSGVRTGSNSIVGTFYGNLNRVEFQTAAKNSAILELISPKGEQTYNLVINDENGLVYDAIDQKDLKLADLSRGQTVDVTFNCFPKLNNQFKIAKISVVGK